VCLVLMPMYAGFEDVRAQVANAITLAGFEMCRLEVEIADSAWHLWLLDAVDRADVVLVDLTDHNPFVMYELGYAHRRQLPTTLIVNARTERVPATVRGAVCIPYGEGCEDFERALIDELQHTWRAVGDRRTRGPAATVAGCPDETSIVTGNGDLYMAATALAVELSDATGRTLIAVDEREFQTRLMVTRRRGAVDPRSLPGHAAARTLLSLVLEHSDRVDVMHAIAAWRFDLRAVHV
jgi:hypothetical protein